MGQSSISTKYTITATTGTTGTTFVPVGRDSKQILAWKQVLDAAVPASDARLTISGDYRYVKGSTTGWRSKLVYVVPVMRTIASGDASGYVATPAVADRTVFNLQVDRSALMSPANALRALDEWAFALLTDDALRKHVMGYQPADT